MRIMRVGSTDNMKQVIKTKDYEQWLELHHLKNAHRSNYIFNSPNGYIHPLYADVNNVYIDVDTMKNRPDQILNDYFYEKGDIRRMFISSGRHFHLLLDMNRIPAQHAKSTINSFMSILAMDTGIVFDDVSNLLHLRRSVGSINPKSGEMTCFYDPDTFETSLQPIILGQNSLSLKVVQTLRSWQMRKKRKKLLRRRGDTDPYDLQILLPDDFGHYSRISVLRKLRNGGVTKKKSLEFMESWLSRDKYDHMIGEGVVDRIFNYRL